MIQDIGNHHYDNAYRPTPPSADSYVLYYNNRKALVIRQGDQITFPRFRDLEGANPQIFQDYTYLFSIDDDHFYLINELNIPDSLRGEMISIRDFRGAAPRYLAFAGITGHQLAQWYASRRFCGRCGSRMRQDTKERMMYCDHCHQMEYPKICPAVIIGVTHQNKLLLTKYAHREFTNYALVAGFCEIGESLEDTIRREVMEEVCLKVINIRYYKSQPWSFTYTLLAGFYCDLEEEDAIRLQEDELALAQWFERENVPVNDPNHASLTQEMITYFKEGHA